MSNHDPERRFHLTLKPEPGNEHDFVSLRRVLKGLLRRHGMRCVDLRELKPTDLTDSNSSESDSSTEALNGSQTHAGDNST